MKWSFSPGLCPWGGWYYIQRVPRSNMLKAQDVEALTPPPNSAAQLKNALFKSSQAKSKYLSILGKDYT